MKICVSVLSVCALAGSALAGGSPSVVNFDPPMFAQGPSTYAAAGPEQVLTVPGTATFSGGVLLGFPTNFPAIPFATAPNLYATSNIGHATLDPVITINVDPTYVVDQVEGVIFNGMTVARDFRIEAYSGATLVDVQNFTLQSNSNNGFGVFSVSNNPIDKVLIMDTGTDGQWNILIDTVVFNQNIPAPGAMALLGLGGLVAARRRRA